MTRRLVAWIGVVLVLTACGRLYTRTTGNRSGFEREFDAFIRAAEKSGRDTSGFDAIEIVFSDELTVGGRCSRPIVGDRKVLIQRFFWKVISEEMRMRLVFHELGHCLLNQEHRENGIMSPNYQDSLGGWDESVEELFSH